MVHAAVDAAVDAATRFRVAKPLLKHSYYIAECYKALLPSTTNRRHNQFVQQMWSKPPSNSVPAGQKQGVVYDIGEEAG